MHERPDKPHFRRDLTDQVARRAEHLPPADRALLLAALDQGVSTRDLAAMTGRDLRYVRRHVKNLARRVLSERFGFVIRNRDAWPSLRRRIAVACILHGRTLREAAAENSTTFYNARKQMDAVQLLIESLKPASPNTPASKE